MVSQRVRHDWVTKHTFNFWYQSSAQFSRSVMSDSLWPMDCYTTGLSVHHQLLEFTQTHVYQVSDTIQPSYPLLSPSPPSFNLSEHQSLFQCVSSSHQVVQILEHQLHTSILPMNIQDWSPLGWTGLISSQSKGLSRVFSKITVQKHQFFGAQLSLWSNSHIHTWLLKKTIALTRWTCFVGKVMTLI